MTENSEKLTKQYVVGSCHDQFKVSSRYLFRDTKTVSARVPCPFSISNSLLASTKKST